MNALDRFAWPDTADTRQQSRSGAGWPRHRARARGRRARKLRRTRTEETTR